MTGRNDKERAARRFRRRAFLVLALFVLAAVGLAVRAVDLQLLDEGFLAQQGDARHLRTVKISAHRGTIYDRHGEPLAVSTPVDSVWANPSELTAAADRLPKLAAVIERGPKWLLRKLTRNMEREFVYLRRHMSPDAAAAVEALDLPGVHILREYRRYYPNGEVTGHVLGFTDIDDHGQEGLELAYEHWLRGQAGSKRVLQDRLGRSVENVESIRTPRPGQALVTSLDLRVQYLAYRELKAAVQRHGASAGCAVVLDVGSGEVLAMANQPAYNPNDRAQFAVARYRNRAVTDIFEPGSSLKPLIVAAALESGRYTAASSIDTAPGFIEIGANRVSDTRNHGAISLRTVLARSSNVGITKVALSLDAERLWSVLTRLGLGQLSSSGFPGESAGLLNHYSHWRPISQATLAYGYGLSVTPLQLVNAYASIASGGFRYPVSFLRAESPVEGERVVSETSAVALLDMLETVVSAAGTGTRAAVRGYRVAGKTGTSWKYEAGGYSEDRYTAVFVGVAPASRPRLAAVVMIDDPIGDEYYGGDVAAPVFAAIMSGALRLMAVAPDRPADAEAGTLVQAMERR